MCPATRSSSEQGKLSKHTRQENLLYMAIRIRGCHRSMANCSCSKYNTFSNGIASSYSFVLDKLRIGRNCYLWG